MDIDERRLRLRVRAEQARAKPIRVNNLALLVQVKRLTAGYTSTSLDVSIGLTFSLSLAPPPHFSFYLSFSTASVAFSMRLFFFSLSFYPVRRQLK